MDQPFLFRYNHKLGDLLQVVIGTLVGLGGYEVGNGERHYRRVEEERFRVMKEQVFV